MADTIVDQTSCVSGGCEKVVEETAEGPIGGGQERTWMRTFSSVFFLAPVKGLFLFSDALAVMTCIMLRLSPFFYCNSVLAS